MKKGLQTTLFAVAASIAGVSSSYAIAPTIKSLPDITIGDKETLDAGGTDSNYFVFTNAFRFDSHAVDGDTPLSQLVWTFVEGDDPGTGAATDYYEVNNKRAVATGTTEAATLVSNPAPLHNPANNVRTGEYASFRDIVFSPTPGTSFPNPTTAHGAFTVSQHAAGKTVTFYVSDGENLASDEIVVKTVDGVNDKASATLPVYTSDKSDTFGSNSNGWTPSSGNTATPLQSTSYNAANTALYATIGPVGSINPPPARIIGWLENQNGDSAAEANNGHLTYAEAQGKFVRAKFHVFATGQPGTDKNQVPNMRLRITSRFAFASVLEVDHHTQQGDAEGTQYSQDLTPSTDATKPSVYRVDMAPPTLPFLNNNTTEGLQRMFEAYSTAAEPDAQGTIALAESSIGTYAALTTSNDPGTLIKVYQGAADMNRRYYDLRQYSRGSLTLTNINLNGTQGLTFGGVTYQGVPAGEAAVASDASGVDVSTAGTPDTKLATAAVDWLNGNAQDDTLSNRARVEENTQYLVRFTATSTQASSNNALLRFRARTAKFNYTQRLEVGNAWNQATSTVRDATRPSHILAHQYLPGAGGYAGTYDVLMVSPLVGDIRPDVNGAITAKMPNLAAQPGPGANTASRRDLFPAVDIIDSLSGSYWNAGSSDAAEKGHVKVSKIEIFKFPLVQD